MSTQVHPAVQFFLDTGAMPTTPNPAPAPAPSSSSSSSSSGKPSVLPGDVPFASDALKGTPLGTLSTAGKLLDAVSSPGFWIRAGQFLLGGLFLLMGVYLMASESAAGQRIKSQAETAAVVASA